MFTLLHTQLAKALGVSADELTALADRHLTDGLDYTRKTRQPKFTEDAARKLTIALQSPPPPAGPSDPTPPEKAAPAPACAHGDASADVITNATRWPVEIRLLAWAPLRDGRTIEAYRPGTDPADAKNRVRVRVRDNRHFHRLDHLGRPMSLIALQTGDNQFELKGRPPQFPRRWGREQKH